jgi:hypothetical protein
MATSTALPAAKSMILLFWEPEVVDQRPLPANLTYRNVDAFSFWGKFTAETSLPGCPERIRTLKYGDARHPAYFWP